MKKHCLIDIVHKGNVWIFVNVLMLVWMFVIYYKRDTDSYKYRHTTLASA